MDTPLHPPLEAFSGAAGDEEVRRQLVQWFALPTPREQRRFLETHLHLLAPASDGLLMEELGRTGGQPAEPQRLREALRVLQDARTRGGTEEAVRAAYVNRFGGWALDVPAWLAPLEQERALWQHSRRPDQAEADRRRVLLHQALARSQDDPTMAAEIQATLQYELAHVLWKSPCLERRQVMEEALSACHAACRVFTDTGSPHQSAQLQLLRGHLYRDRMAGEPRENIEEALSCYHRALQAFSLEASPFDRAVTCRHLGVAFWKRMAGQKRANLEQALAYVQESLLTLMLDAFPYDYGQSQHQLGVVYWSRISGDRRENLERAIICYNQALQVMTLERFPAEYAEIQNDLSLAYRHRIAGEKRENLERAIACQHDALRVVTFETFPDAYAQSYNNLGLIYWQRIAEDRAENLERAIACYQQALRVYDRILFPYDYARTQNNLGLVYRIRLRGERRENLEHALACFRETLRVCTRESYPYEYALTQNSLGNAYRERGAGNRRENLEQAIACYQEALGIRTLEAFPYDHAQTQNNLGNTYRERFQGERNENLKQAIACYRQALRVYTLHAYPHEHRRTNLACAETQAQLGDWLAAHESYTAGREAEDLLVALGAGAVGRDLVLKEGRDAHARDGFVLTRLGKIEEAAVAIERGRARGLAEAIQFNAADPMLIKNTDRRTRYTEARQAFVAAQAALHAPLPSDLDEDGRRRLDLERTAAYRAARTAFDALVAEIREAEDPADFLGDTFAASSILAAAESCGKGHALVYLAATPWGGLALAAFAAHPGWQTAPRFAALDLPALTTDLLSELLETRLGDDADRVTGGFACALQGNAFDRLRAWPGETLRAKAEALHAACREERHTGTLDLAAQELLAIPVLRPLVDQPPGTLGEAGTALLHGTLAHLLVQRELARCLRWLGEVAALPVMAWLREEGASSLTLIPCGQLAAFPLAAIPLADGRTLAETLPVSIVPSARSLWRNTRSTPESAILRQGLYALGNPAPTQQELRWGEAEALTLAKLAEQLGLPAQSRVQWQATRDWLLAALQAGLVVEASCHGRFDLSDFLRSRLLLANQKEVTLADLLSYQVDVRGLRLLILSACQTALLDLKGARDEVRSLAAGMLQAGARAVLAALWPVDDKATYLLMVRFAQEWLPRMAQEAPAEALARAQRWLRTVTNQELQTWQATIADTCQMPAVTTTSDAQALEPAAILPGVQTEHLVAVRGGGVRFDTMQAQERIRETAEEGLLENCPYADPYYWAAFQVIGW